MLGLSWALRAVGKETVLTCVDGCPDTFRFLPGSETIVKKLGDNCDLFIFVDCADQSRAGKAGEQVTGQPHLNFDHHVTNPGFAQVNFVDANKTATSELLTDLLAGLGLPLTKEAAECFLCGLVSDTLGFRTANTGPAALACAQTLVAAGADLPYIYDYSLNRRSFAAVQLWGQVLSRTNLVDGLAWATIPLALKQAVGYNGKGDADVINVLGTINEANVFITMIENPDNNVKISWRARPGLDVAKIAQSFGGGGHVSAAGATVAGTLAEVEEKILAGTRTAMANVK